MTGFLTTISDVLRPSGDRTGATDRANINTALASSAHVVTLRDATFYVDQPVSQPSGTTLVLHNATLRLVNGANCNLWRNTNQTIAGDTDVHVIGRGRALFDGNPIGQARQFGYSCINNVGLNAVRVKDLHVEGIQIGAANFWCTQMQGVVHSTWRNIRFEMDGLTLYQGAISVGLGCQDIVCDGIYGDCYDDVFTIYAMQYGSAVFSELPLHTLYQPGSTLDLGVSDIAFRNADVRGRYSLVRFFIDNTSSIRRVRGENLTKMALDGHSGALFEVGSPTFWIGSGHAPVAGTVSDVTMTNLAGGFTGSSPIALDSHIDRLKVSGLDLRDTSFASVVGHRANDYSPTLRDIVIEGVKAGSPLAGGDLMKIRAGSTVSNFTVRDVEAVSLGSVLNNAATVTGVHVADVHVGTALQIPFSSTTAETGEIRDVVIDALYPGVTKRYQTAMAARMSGIMPTFTTADTTPLATLGSRALCASSKVLDAGAANAAEYVGNGTAWKRAVDLA